MVVCMAIGIMFGCLWAGSASRGQIRFGFVTLGAWGIVGCLSALALISAREGTVVWDRPGAADSTAGQPAGGECSENPLSPRLPALGGGIFHRRAHAE